MLETKALSASYAETIYGFFTKFFGEFYTAEKLMGKGAQSFLQYPSSQSLEQDVEAMPFVKPPKIFFLKTRSIGFVS